MIKKMVLILAVMTLLVSTGMGEEADRLIEARQRADDFTATVTMLGVTDGGWQVDGVAEFLIEVKQEKVTAYDLYFYRDGALEDVARGIISPHVFRQNFAGFNDGTYPLEFFLIDRDGNVGRVKRSIEVKHQAK